MARKTTRLSRVSVGWVTSDKSVVDYDAADTGAVFSVTGPASYTGAQTFTGDVTIAGATSDLSVGATAWIGGATSLFGALTGTSTASFNGAATLQSTLTVRGASTLDGAVRMNSTLTTAGDATFTGGIFVGSAAAINEIVAISTATAAVSIGALAGHESSSIVTAGLSGATRGDHITLTLDSIYAATAANRDVIWNVSSSSTAGEVNIWAVNSTATSVTPTASTVVRLVRMNFASFI